MQRCVETPPRLEVVLQSELDDAWRIGREDSGRRRTGGIDRKYAEGVAGCAQVRRVGEVEGFKAELKPVAFPGHLEVLQHEKVDVFPARQFDQALSSIVPLTRDTRSEG